MKGKAIELMIIKTSMIPIIKFQKLKVIETRSLTN